jgi:TPR repeat protein
VGSDMCIRHRPLAAARAAADLFRPLEPPSATDRGAEAPAPFALAPSALPGLPEAPAPLDAQPVDLDVDPDLLVLYDAARTADSSGKERPDEAAGAWNAVAQAAGDNPFRQTAAERARQWETYAGGKRAFDARRMSDSSRVRKVLPLRWVSDWIKLELVARYARAYGAERASRLLPQVRLPALREQASLAVACEAREPEKCVALARAADGANETQVAVGYLDRACTAGSASACAEAGDRLLAKPARDVQRALATLQRGCAAEGAQACARLAQVYEEGDGAAIDLAFASELRNKACAAGDGRSCRRLACLIDPGASSAAKARAEELWASACRSGDLQSCALAKAAAGPEPAHAVQAQPAATPQADGTQAFDAARAALDRRQSLGFGLVALGAVLGSGAAVIAFDAANDPRFTRGRDFTPASARTPGMAYVLGGGALISAGVGLSLLLTRPDPEPAKLSVGVGPGAVLVSGALP